MSIAHPSMAPPALPNFRIANTGIRAAHPRSYPIAVGASGLVLSRVFLHFCVWRALGDAAVSAATAREVLHMIGSLPSWWLTGGGGTKGCWFSSKSGIHTVYFNLNHTACSLPASFRQTTIRTSSRHYFGSRLSRPSLLNLQSLICYLSAPYNYGRNPERRAKTAYKERQRSRSGNSQRTFLRELKKRLMGAGNKRHQIIFSSVDPGRVRGVTARNLLAKHEDSTGCKTLLRVRFPWKRFACLFVSFR